MSGFTNNGVWRFIKKYIFGGRPSTPADALGSFGVNTTNSALVSAANKGTSIPGTAGSPASGSSGGIGDIFRSLSAYLFRNELTGAEREANAFTAERQDIAWQRELEASNTQYQRATEDMKAAGLNPVLAAGAGTSQPSAAAVGSVSPSAAAFQLPQLIQSLASLKLIDAQTEQARAGVSNIIADTDLKESQAAKNREETTGLQIDNMNKPEQWRIAIEKGKVDIDQVKKAIDEIQERIELTKKQAATEEERRSLTIAQTVLANAQAEQVLALIPYQRELLRAQTEQARAAALASATHAAYEQKMIDSGYIEKQVENLEQQIKKAGFDITTAEAASIKARCKQMFLTGNVDEAFMKDNALNRVVLRTVFQPIALILDQLNPLNSVITKTPN